MKISEIDKKELLVLCNDLLFKTIIELGQNKKEDWFLVMSNSLANDLIEDFPKLSFIDIIRAFREGVRNVDDLRFVLNVQTYYLWIKNHRQLIWDNSSVEPNRIDKRLKYRSRKGTGLLEIKKALK
tara:strand:- start:3177 stop:3554 length:378 start_codon:yes stop_codon:yes gene_type:complete